MSARIFVFFFAVSLVPCQTENYEIISNITANKCRINESVAFWCTVNSMLSNSVDVLWYRSVGSSKQVIGQSSMLSIEFDGGRYRTSILKKTQIMVTYELLISSVQLQDSAIIQCVSPTSKQINSVNSFPFAVCETTNSSFCNCIIAEGWASPNCNKVVEEKKAKRYESQRGCIGIGVILAFVLLACLVLTILLVTNEMRSHKERERDKQAMRAEMENNNQTKFSKPSGPSILKNSKNPQESSIPSRPKIDTFSMTQLQQISFQDAAVPKEQQLGLYSQHNFHASNPSSQESSNLPAIQIVHREGDIQYYIPNPQLTNRNMNSESQI